jgi:hypothetical protein
MTVEGGRGVLKPIWRPSGRSRRQLTFIGKKILDVKFLIAAVRICSFLLEI